jgi:hypothetical protein
VLHLLKGRQLSTTLDKATHDEGCICHGNWRAIVKETAPLIGKRFRDQRGDVYSFFGVVHGDDDYYYGMFGCGKLQLLSCVGSIAGHGFEQISA